MDDGIPHIELLLDSGAFTCWQQKVDVDIGAYIDFIYAHNDHVRDYVNLDVLPGEPGKRPTRGDVEIAARDSHRNHMIMKRAGLDPMPVFHFGERWYWLEKMVAEGNTSLGLGGVARANSRVALTAWLDEVFTRLCGSHPYPSVDVHGFAITNPSLILRYPWHSVDSVSWMLTGGFGNVLLPHLDGPGDYNWLKQPTVVNMSIREEGKASSKRTLSGKHFNNMGPTKQRIISDFIEANGLRVKQVQHSYVPRCILNVRYYAGLGSHFEAAPFKRGGAGLFDHHDQRHGEGLCGTATQPNDFRMLFSMPGTSFEYDDILNVEGVGNRLVSYYYFLTDRNKDIERYVTTGFFKPRTKPTRVRGYMQQLKGETT